MSNLHDFLAQIDPTKPQTTDIPRGCFDASRFVHEGGNPEYCPYIDTTTAEYCGQLATAQRVYINASVFSTFEAFSVQAEAAKTSALFGDAINGGSVTRTTDNILLSTRPAFLLEYDEYLCCWITWLNAAAITSESEFARIKRLAKAEEERRQKILDRATFKSLAVQDLNRADGSGIAYPSRCNSIVQRGCTWELAIT